MEMAIWIQNYSRKSDFESGVKLNRVKSRGVGKNQQVVGTFSKTKKSRGELFRPKIEIKRYFFIFVVRSFKKEKKYCVWGGEWNASGSYAPEVWLQINITANFVDTCSLSIENEPKDMQYAYAIICFR